MTLEPPDEDLVGAFFSMLIGGFIWLGTLGLLIAYFSMPVWQALRSHTWTETRCRIGQADMRQSSTRVRGHEVTTERVRAAYTYRVGKRDFSSERYDFTNGSFESGAYDEVERLNPGASVRCFYDPSDPAEATLERRGFRGSLMAFLIELTGAAGPLLFLDGLQRFERTRRRPLSRGFASVAAAVTALALLVGMGLSVFAGAPVWAWLLFSALPIGLLLLFRNLPRHKP